MRIAVFASSYHPHLGGVEEVVHRLARAHHALGHETIVITNRWPRDLPRNDSHEGVAVHRLALRAPIASLKSKATYLATTRQVTAQATRLVGDHRADLVHVHCVSTNALYASRVAHRLGLPIVVTAHGELTMDADQLFQRDLRSQQLLRRIGAEASAFTACSGKTLADVEAFLGTPFGARGTVILNGTDTDLFGSAAPVVRPRPYVFAIGRHVPQKGFDLLIRALARVERDAPLDLVLAGDGPEHDALAKLASTLGIGDRVELIGRIDRGATAAWMRGAALIALPSRVDEGLPLVAIEALASGRPLLATRSGGVGEVATDGISALFVEMGDVDALAEGIRRLHDDPMLAARLGDAGRRRAAELDWTAVAEEYAEVYRRVLAARPARSGR